jgi:hypothetical protein
MMEGKIARRGKREDGLVTGLAVAATNLAVAGGGAVALLGVVVEHDDGGECG